MDLEAVDLEAVDLEVVDPDGDVTVADTVLIG